ncbi:uncharacterized protein LOC119466657 [Dermacentor silvarum]|uniref:uncharacterized protein LOC119466657 n=1 Tax=Dermacentor silvarum TaxID=543639 RepID=UPI0021019E6F|nr:uncharacterized protein LOC119466657 [Dermacentor silvarum]
MELPALYATVRQAHRGWAFKEEGYVKNVMLSLSTSDPQVGLVRAPCLPSMKSGAYIATAWYRKASGDIAGAHCTCVAGLSQSCQHVAGVLLSVTDKTAKEQESCIDVPLKKQAPRLPLQDIPFQRHVVSKPAYVKKQRKYDPCPYVRPSQDEISKLKANLSAMLLYPSNRAMSEAMVYGRMHEQDAVEAYSILIRSRDVQLEVTETGLHIHKHYPFLAASPYRIVVLDGEQGLLEVKCLFSKKGMTAEDASKDSKFCCMLKDGQVYLKKDHAYYYQVQGQMATTGHKWCDFVIWTEAQNRGEMHHIHVERIFFDRPFWENHMLPAILHFMLKAFIPEVLTRRVKRLGKLYTTGQYVSYKKIKDGFYVCSLKDSLVLNIKKLK